MKDSRLLDDFSTVIVLILVRYLAVIAFFESSTTNLATVEAVSLDIYWDSLCTRVANSIDWGSLRSDHQKRLLCMTGTVLIAFMISV